VGTSTVTFTATDRAGNSASATFTVTVNPAGFVGVSPNRVLYVVGTSANETMVITANGTASVTIGGSGVPGSPFTLVSTDTISVFGNDGNDNITVSGTGSNRARLYGGAGTDTLTISGSRNAILVGGAGNDNLNANANSGRVLMIGGDGLDALSANGASCQAIMIGERTSYDDPTVAGNIAALDAILNEWASGRNYNQRTSNILSGGGALAGTGVALTSSRVFDDGQIDVLTGPSGGGSAQNWFIKKAGQTTITKRTSETITTL
jgi:hypothetical protein